MKQHTITMCLLFNFIIAYSDNEMQFYVEEFSSVFVSRDLLTTACSNPPLLATPEL